MRVIDYNGKEFDIKTYAFSDTAVQTRKPEILEKNLLKENLLIKKIGKTKLMLVSAENAVSCTQRMMEKNILFYGTASYE